MGLKTATTVMIPVCSFLVLLLLHAPISQALAPSSRGRKNRVPLKLTLQHEAVAVVGKEQSLLELQEYTQKLLSPKHYTIVMDAWGKAGHVEKAADLFEEMIELGAENPAIAPNRVSYNVL
jgi:pentatricopeptide repeat protein